MSCRISDGHNSLKKNTNEFSGLSLVYRVKLRQYYYCAMVPNHWHFKLGIMQLMDDCDKIQRT